MRRRIFLDIDGVVATNRTYNVWKKAGSPGTFDGFLLLFDAAAVQHVNDLARSIGAQIVVSSNWRHPETCPHPVREVLVAAGIEAPIVGETPCFCRVTGGWSSEKVDGHRGSEIAAYMRDHALTPSDVVILDDDRKAGVAPPGTARHGARLICTPESTGLSAKHVQRAVRLFDAP